MKFDFDRLFDRRNTNSLKWDKYRGRDVIPLWVADMDFQAPGPVLESLHERVDHGIFGYCLPDDELVAVVIARLQAKYKWRLNTRSLRSVIHLATERISRGVRSPRH